MFLRIASPLLTAATLVLGTTAIAACGAAKPAEAPHAIAPTTMEAPRPAAPVGDSVVIAPDLKRLCHIDDVDGAPKFEFDSARLESNAYGPLEKLARCLSTGPLRGRSVMLVGRADPRGASEYNMVLGAERASSVKTYLRNLGVSSAALDTTSRGELDARGHDDSSWAVDRRVDIDLAGG